MSIEWDLTLKTQNQDHIKEYDVHILQCIVEKQNAGFF